MERYEALVKKQEEVLEHGLHPWIRDVPQIPRMDPVNREMTTLPPWLLEGKIDW